MKRFFYFVVELLYVVVACLIVLLTCEQSTLEPPDKVARVRVFTRGVEFNYLEWMLDAAGLKNANAALASQRYLTQPQQKKLVYDYLDLLAETDRLSSQIARVYADPNVKDAATQTAAQREKRDQLRARQAQIGPLAESIIQAQVAAVLKDANLTFLGQPLPPVLYHITPLPYALIVSPRDHIEQELMVSLLPGMALEDRIAMENQVGSNLDKSTLVVGIGGVGVYPTMVMSTTDLVWLTDTVAHEWTHNFLELRPLGLTYDGTPELRTINETTASIVGKEIGQLVMERFYPERAPKREPEQPAPAPDPQPQSEPPKFDFNKEMRVTRLGADELFKQGKIDEAEAYMETRRKFFWDNGYQIRKLNQAYFAFYGAYNDQPGGSGESGQDPVGPAVQELRKQSHSVADFLNRISWIWSYKQLQEMVKSHNLPKAGGPAQSSPISPLSPPPPARSGSSFSISSGD